MSSVGKPFEKGRSGNPGGRSKAHAEMARLIAEKTNNGADLVAFAIDVWKGIVPGMDGEKSRQWAHDWLTDRGFGKALQIIDLGTTEPRRTLDFNALSNAQLEALAVLDAGGSSPDDDGPG